MHWMCTTEVGNEKTHTLFEGILSLNVKLESYFI